MTDLTNVDPDTLYDRFILTTDALVTGLPVVQERRELGAEIVRRLDELDARRREVEELREVIDNFLDDFDPGVSNMRITLVTRDFSALRAAVRKLREE